MKMYLQTLFYISSSWKQWQINCTWVVNLYDDDFFFISGHRDGQTKPATEPKLIIEHFDFYKERY